MEKTSKMSENAQEEDSTNDGYDQDSSISFEDDTESTSSQEEESEDWIERIKRSAREEYEKMGETQKKLQWRQALWIATQNPDRWTRRPAEWSPGLVTWTRSQRKAGRPAKRWKDGLNEFVKDEE